MSDEVDVGSTRDEDGTVAIGRPTRRRQLIQALITTAVVVIVFGFVIPRLADYRAVLDYIANVAAAEWLVLGGLAAVVLLAYVFVIQAAMRTLRFAEGYVAQTTAQAINNALPAGGAIALPLQYAMYMAWGFTPHAVTSMFLAVGVWDQFGRFGLPIIALGIGALTLDTEWWMWAVAGWGVISIAFFIWLLRLVFTSEDAAHRVGAFLERWINRILHRFGRPPMRVAAAVLQFRSNAIDIVRHRWKRITVTTAVNQAAQAGLFLASVRTIGIGADEVPTVWVIAAFALGRLLTMIPVSPGGLGLVDLGWIGLLTAGWQTGTADADLIAAATLLFRALTYLPPIVLGAISWVIYRLNTSWYQDWRSVRRGEWAQNTNP